MDEELKQSIKYISIYQYICIYYNTDIYTYISITGISITGIFIYVYEDIYIYQYYRKDQIYIYLVWGSQWQRSRFTHD